MAVLASPVGLRAQGVSAGTRQGATPKQHFVCNTGYTLEKCHVEMEILRKALAKYPTAALGEWTWVLVRSEDWKPLLLVRHFNSSNPACTFLPAKETFLEEALVLPMSSRGVELSVVWHMSMENLLDLAVRHELGHALCLERDEAEADRVAALCCRRQCRFPAIEIRQSRIRLGESECSIEIYAVEDGCVGEKLWEASRAAVAIGADGLSVEVQPAPRRRSAMGRSRWTWLDSRG